MRLLYTGDWHLRGKNPRNRTDEYVAAATEKLREVFALATKWLCKAIVAPGDIFDSAEVSISVLLYFTEVLKESPVPIYTTAGNHDIYGYNISTYQRSSLKLLEMLVPQLQVMTDPTTGILTVEGSEKVAISFSPFTARMDINGYGYSPEYDVDLYKDTYKIHVAHGMLLDHKPPFDRYTLIQDVHTTADLVLTGHDHLGYGTYKRADGKLFSNPGALLRMSASQSEIGRTVAVNIIDVMKTETSYTATIETVPLQCAKPGDEVLDRSRIEAEQQRAYAMESFAAVIQAHTGEKVLVDINQIIETIAAEEGTAPHIVKAVLEIIDQQREKVKP